MKEKYITDDEREKCRKVADAFAELYEIENILVAKENNIYIDYLKNKGSSLERLSEYIHNMAKLDDNILQMAMYLSFVVICIVSLTKFKYRKGFYVASAIVYLIAMTSIFSNGLTDYIVSNIFAFVAKINKETFTYIDMNIVKEYFLDTLKESMMTVVIFDTIFQFKQSERNTKRIKDIRYLLARNPGRVFSKDQIYDIVWKESYSGDYNIIMSHIRNIREKIEDNPSKPIYIQTVWGVGYRFNKNLTG